MKKHEDQTIEKIIAQKESKKVKTQWNQTPFST